jgi:hypothetical protein
MRSSIILLLACSMLLMGCPKEKRALNVARKAVEASAMTVDLIDAEASDLYTEAAASALASCETRVCYDSSMRKWNKTVLAVSSMKRSLLIVEGSLDAWEAGSPNGQNNLLNAAGCFLGSMVELHLLLNDVGARAPALEQGLSFVYNLFGASLSCNVGTTP